MSEVKSLLVHDDLAQKIQQFNRKQYYCNPVQQWETRAEAVHKCGLPFDEYESGNRLCRLFLHIRAFLRGCVFYLQSLYPSRKTPPLCNMSAHLHEYVIEHLDNTVRNLHTFSLGEVMKSGTQKTVQ